MAAAWGAAVGELSKYQPWLVSIFAPSGGAQMTAWVTLSMATAPILITVLTHHGLMPASVAEKIGGVASVAGHVDATTV